MPSVEQVYHPDSVSNSLAHQRFAPRLPRRFCFPEVVADGARPSLAGGSKSTSLNIWRRGSDVPASSSSLSLCRTVRRLTAPTTSCVRGDAPGSLAVTAASLCDASASSVAAAAGRIHCWCPPSCREQHCWLVPSILSRRLVWRERWSSAAVAWVECHHSIDGIRRFCADRSRLPAAVRDT